MESANPPAIDLGEALREIRLIADGRRYADAISACRRLLAASPASAEILAVMGELHASVGDNPQAIAWFQRSLQVEPSAESVQRKLVDVLRRLGRLAEALEICDKRISDRPDDASWIVERGLCLLAGQQFEPALKALERAVELAPSIGSYRYHLGVARMLAGMRPAAIDALQTAIHLDRKLVDAHLRLGQILLSLGRREEAIESFRTSLELDPDLAEAEISWAEALIELGRADEANEHIKPVSTADPGVAISQGFRLQALGRFTEARDCFLHALSLAPFEGAAYYGIVRGQRIVPTDRVLIDRMVTVARDQRLRMMDKIYLQFGLGKVYEDLGDYRSAMRHYEEANGLAAMHRHVKFDLASLAKYNDWRVQAFRTQPVAHFQQFGSTSEKPIFVVGMIRSGTTLLEQMLSAHPAIGGCGEMLYWSEKQDEFNGRIAKASIDGGYVAATASEYLQLLEQMAPGKLRAVDKMPMNFFLVGPIHVALPHARFIHLKRNAADNCFSIFTTYFESSPSFANDQESIVAYYREYERLMAHWKELVPAERFLEVNYEDLVSSPEPQMRRIVDFCGVPWDEASLHPEANPRAVRTPSAWQVRQPTYETSKHRAENFAPWLGAIKELL